MAEQTYKIIRFRQHGESEVLRRGVTLAYAQEWCNDESTSGPGWFDGWTADDE